MIICSSNQCRMSLHRFIINLHKIKGEIWFEMDYKLLLIEKIVISLHGQHYGPVISIVSLLVASAKSTVLWNAGGERR